MATPRLKFWNKWQNMMDEYDRTHPRSDPDIKTKKFFGSAQQSSYDCEMWLNLTNYKRVRTWYDYQECAYYLEYKEA